MKNGVDKIMITATGKSLMEIYNLLLSSFGPQNWWPAETELEIDGWCYFVPKTNQLE